MACASLYLLEQRTLLRIQNILNQVVGVTWYNLISNQRTGLNAVTVPGTLRDSLILLGVVLEQQTELQPTRIMTDAGAYSDIAFGLFRLLGLRFSP